MVHACHSVPASFINAIFASLGEKKRGARNGRSSLGGFRRTRAHTANSPFLPRADWGKKAAVPQEEKGGVGTPPRHLPGQRRPGPASPSPPHPQTPSRQVA